jgi:hypothetical protein
VDEGMGKALEAGVTEPDSRRRRHDRTRRSAFPGNAQPGRRAEPGDRWSADGFQKKVEKKQPHGSQTPQKFATVVLWLASNKPLTETL